MRELGRFDRAASLKEVGHPPGEPHIIELNGRGTELNVFWTRQGRVGRMDFSEEKTKDGEAFE